MFRRRNNDFHRHASRRFGSVFAGLALTALGLFQFLQSYFGIEWSQLWPLFLAVPGLALALRAAPVFRADHPTEPVGG